MEIEILDPNNIAAAAAANSGIKNTTGLYDDSYAPTPIFTIKSTPQAQEEPDPTTDAETGNEYEDNDYDDDDDEDYDDDNDKVKEVEPPEKVTPVPILIESDDKYIGYKEFISEEEEDPVAEQSGRYPTIERKQVTRLIPTRAGKNYDSGYIHLNIDTTKEKRYNHIIHIIMTQYSLKKVLNNFKE